ncbi:S-adenosyl-L-methionine-dependent methyltransferase [Fomitopsis serialis]|uniref:S-adenosyl-L-methionine-dependent methyltransferase n=1 Tax=Fomitopsis serialis TaxID=139415 RepID=UPI00200779AC|nr:S-adenosyl-L-methionine-dependent methyltransferase [Neoantrodia serialis]XP_047894377.1 S-adenosyl-L-methionine-dependent methyltransferase [Neoantrodia serialis]KAH9922130.1 S-adenosyl-L-methionine-dependent methyltransferase [Neoantrodia serialis]KAH9927734.1 S-adenosyl-L-methionine-dependent methyltransferase [Neoantrodia serialis]
MATFAQKTFDAVRYAAARPTYPKQLYDFLFAHHGRDPRARWDTALDLGCGTGQATLELTPFKNVIGSDPSEGMLVQAREVVKSRPELDRPGRFKFVQSAAEELGWLEEGSVDLIVSAQAAHWFDWAKLWPEAARVLKPGGTLAAWGYSQFRLPQYPSLTPLIHEYCQGTDPLHSVGPYWERPGRTIVDDHLQAIPDPRTLSAASWADFERVYFTRPHHALPEARPSILRTRTTWAGMLAYLQTFSALHTMKAKVPEAADVEVRFWRKLREEVARLEGKDGGEAGEGEEVEVEWPMAVLLARRA